MLNEVPPAKYNYFKCYIPCLNCGANLIVFGREMMTASCYFLANSLLLVILFSLLPLYGIDGVYNLSTELFLYIKIAKLQSLHEPVRGS